MRDKPSAEVNSVIISPQPDRWLLIAASTFAESDSRLNRLALRMKRRKTVSVTPAMGASIVAGATWMPPIETHAGTHALAGIACSIGLSQFFFMTGRQGTALRAFVDANLSGRSRWSRGISFALLLTMKAPASAEAFGIPALR